MEVTDVSLHDENFWPSITQTVDGRVFLVDGGRTSLVRVEGLETLARLPETTLTVTSDDLQRARDWFAKAEARRQRQRGSGILSVPLLKTGPQVDGQLNDWPATTDWAFIDRRGTKANFNSDSRPYEVSAAVALTDIHLIAAWRTTKKNLLANSGETPNALFKHGGCLDVMLATDPTAAPDRADPAPGDQRLLITRVKDQTRALLYRAKVPGTKEPVAFSSPWRSIQIDVVEDVSQHVSFTTDNAGNYEVSIPLTALHWQPKPGETYRADLGVLRGGNQQTTQRVYWSNKATAITADVPSEAEITPRLWGKWKVVGECSLRARMRFGHNLGVAPECRWQSSPPRPQRLACPTRFSPRYPPPKTRAKIEPTRAKSCSVTLRSSCFSSPWLDCFSFVHRIPATVRSREDTHRLQV